MGCYPVENDIPLVPVRRDGIHLRFTVPCPYCGLFHLHGAAGELGHRAAHCATQAPGSRRGYLLYEVGPSGLPREVLGLLGEVSGNN